MPSPNFRISIRQLLWLTALVALAVASIKYSSDIWAALVLAVLLIAFVAAMVTSIVDRGSAQAFAIGFALVVVSYGAMLQFIPPSLQPTSQLLVRLHDAVAGGDWIDMRTGRTVPGYQRGSAPAGFNRTQLVHFRAAPSERAFTRLGHCWSALLVAYVGGIYARFVYLRRTKRVALS